MAANPAGPLAPTCTQVALAVDNSAQTARIVKGRLEKTTLGQVCIVFRV